MTGGLGNEPYGSTEKNMPTAWAKKTRVLFCSGGLFSDSMIYF